MEYRDEVKDAILRILSKKDIMYWSELYSYIKESYKKIAYETFNFCIKDLLLNNLIDRTEVKEKGKKVYYFVTNRGDQHLRLIIERKGGSSRILLGDDTRRMNLYLLTILFRRAPSVTFESQEKFDAFLEENNMSAADLERHTRGEKIREDKTVIITTYESESGIYVWKIEPLDKRKSPQEKGCIYECTLPGLSMTDILEARNKPAFYHIKFTKSEVQNAFDMLKSESNGCLLAPVPVTYNREIRYDISDPMLRAFVERLYYIYNDVYTITEAIWNNVRKPTPDELRWLILLRGSETADRACRNSYDARRKRFLKIKNKNQYLKKVCKRIRGDNYIVKEYLVHLMKIYADVIEKHKYLCEGLLEITYPRFMEQLYLPVKDT